MDRAPLLTFSHVRWNTVSQRPHNIMSRMAVRRDVVYVEEPILRGGEPDLEVISVAPRLRVVQPHLPFNGVGFGAHQQSALEAVLRGFLAREGWAGFAAWLYTPMAVRLARALEPRALIYDCMDELSSFLLAPPEVGELEAELLRHADAVFTCGSGLHRAKRNQHPFVHCLPSGVDVAHFATANEAPEAHELAGLPHPRLGLFGVVDERMDLDLLSHLSKERPDWQVIVVGPIAKVEASRLPHGENVHYVGQRSYQELPSFLAGWDACLMPFTRDAATSYISPAKCLEYMAAERPIVSTPIPDIAEPFGEIVHLGDGPEGFLEACERALNEPEGQRERRFARARQVIQRTSWEETVDRMDSILRHVAGEGFREETVPEQLTPKGKGA